MTTLQINRYGSVAEILLASPELNNTLHDALSVRMLEALASIEDDGDIRAVILGSTGGIFTAGGDLDMLKTMYLEAQEESQHPKLQARLRDNMKIVERLRDFPKPVIAAVEGPCIGAGIGWVAACDITLATERSFFDTAYMNLGLGTDFGVSWLLTQSIGSTRALDWILRPRRVSAQEAQASGLIGLVVRPGERLMERAHEIAGFLAKSEPELIVSIRQSVRDGNELQLSDALDAEAERFINYLPQAQIQR